MNINNIPPSIADAFNSIGKHMAMPNMTEVSNLFSSYMPDMSEISNLINSKMPNMTEVSGFINNNMPNMTEVSSFIRSNIATIKCPYNVDLPPSAPANLAVLVAAPFIVLGVGSISLRAATGALALGAKGISQVNHLASRVTKSLHENMDAAGNKLLSVTKKSFAPEIKLAVAASLGILMGIAAKNGVEQLIKA